MSLRRSWRTKKKRRRNEEPTVCLIYKITRKNIHAESLGESPAESSERNEDPQDKVACKINGTIMEESEEEEKEDKEALKEELRVSDFLRIYQVW
jgi:hypothetical protein